MNKNLKKEIVPLLYVPSSDWKTLDPEVQKAVGERAIALRILIVVVNGEVPDSFLFTPSNTERLYPGVIGLK